MRGPSWEAEGLSFISFISRADPVQQQVLERIVFAGKFYLVWFVKVRFFFFFFKDSSKSSEADNGAVKGCVLPYRYLDLPNALSP